MFPQMRLQAARLTPIETRFPEAVHTYHGVSPWNRAGTKIVYLGIEGPETGHITVRDCESGNETVLASTREVHYHTAAWQHWALDDQAIAFLDHNAQSELVPTVVRLDQPGHVTTLAAFPGRTLRHVTSDGRHALAYVFSDRFEESKIERLDLAQGTAETVATVREALDVAPPDGYDPASGFTYGFNHPVTNADESCMFFKLMESSPSGGTKFRAFYVMDLPSRAIRCLGDRISGHPYWMPDGRHILNIKGPRDGSGNRWLVLVDSVTGEDRRLIDTPIEGPGHPTPSPDGRWVVTDAFVPNGDECPIYVIDLETGAAKEIARLPHTFVGTGHYESRVTRGQPHPVWSPCSRKLLVNMNHRASRMGLVLLEDFIKS